MIQVHEVIMELTIMLHVTMLHVGLHNLLNTAVSTTYVGNDLI